LFPFSLVNLRAGKMIDVYSGRIVAPPNLVRRGFPPPDDWSIFSVS
jgi:hypothetical protein